MYLMADNLHENLINYNPKFTAFYTIADSLYWRVRRQLFDKLKNIHK